jgi:hypothetical protein
MAAQQRLDSLLSEQREEQKRGQAYGIWQPTPPKTQPTVAFPTLQQVADQLDERGKRGEMVAGAAWG